MEITKEEAPAKIEELKKFVNQEETKPSGIKILHKCGSIIFTSTKSTIKEAVEEAYLSGANLSEANLSDANLSDANLSRADLRGAELNCAKFFGKTSNPKILKKDQVSVFLEALGFKIED